MQAHPDEVRPPAPARRALRIAAWATGGLVLFLVVAAVAIRLLLFPALSQRVDAFADALSRALGQRVEVGALSGRWAGPRIQLELRDVRILAPDGTQAVGLPDVQATFAWRSLFLGHFALSEVTLRRPSLTARRDASGRVHLGGYVIPMLRDAGGGSPPMETIRALDTLNVEDGTLQWIDELRAAPPLTFAQVNVALTRNGDALALDATAAPPSALAKSLAVAGSVRLSELAIATASGTVTPSVRGADLDAWKPWLDFPVDIIQARGDATLSVTLESGRVTAGRIDADLADLDARLAPDLEALELRALRGQLAFGAAAANGVRRITGSGITAVPAAPADAPAVGPIGFETNLPFDGEGETRLSVANLDLALAESVAAALPLPPDARRLLAEAHPRGRVLSAEARITGSPKAPTDHAVDAKVADLSIRRIGRFPGLSGITGSIALRPEGGSAQIAAARMEGVAIPGVPEPLTIDALSGNASWAVEPSGTRLELDRVAIATRDVAAVISGTAADAAGDWRLDLTADVERLDGSRLVHYLSGLGHDAAQWMRTALVRVPLEAGKVRVEGRVADFPFTAPGTGTLEASGRVTRGRLAYAPGWPVLDDIDATLALAGTGLRIEVARATLAGLGVNGGTVVVSDLLGTRPAALNVDARLGGPLAGVLRFVRESPLRKQAGDALDGWGADGPTRIALQLAMPLDKPAAAQPVVTLDLLGNRLTTGIAGVDPLTDLAGQVRIEAGSFAIQSLQGRAFGGPFNASARGGADGRVNAEASGTADFGAVARALEMPAALAPAGTAGYRAQATVGKTLESFRLESDLKGVALPLPAPLGKAADLAWPTRIAFAGDVVDAAVGPAISAKVRVRRAPARTEIERGAVSIGAGPAALPATPGLRVTMKSESIDADRLLSWARSRTADLGTAGGSGDLLAEARIVTPELTIADRHFRDVDVSMRRDGPQRWQLQLQSREIAGRATYAAAGPGRLTARLQRLLVPAPLGTPGATAAHDGPLPALDLQAERFAIFGRNLGRLGVTAANAGTQWQLQRLTLGLPHCRLEASGADASRMGAARGRSSLDFDTTFDDIGLCLTELGRPVEVAGGSGTLKGAISWAGPITDIDVNSLSGSLTLAARNGRFLQVRQGMAGTLLSVLSLRALGDIATFNFRSAFSDGFQFTDVQGSATVADGVLSTRDFSMQGPAATVGISGTADLRHQTQDLRVRVQPALGNAVSAGLTIVNPVLGAGAFLANRLLRTDALNVVSIEHRITGTFSAPQVESGGGR